MTKMCAANLNAWHNTSNTRGLFLISEKNPKTHTNVSKMAKYKYISLSEKIPLSSKAISVINTETIELNHPTDKTTEEISHLRNLSTYGN